MGSESASAHAGRAFGLLPTSATAPGGVNLGNFTAAPTKFTSGPNAGLYSGGFGTIVTPFSTTGIVGQRAGTIVARFQF